MMKREILILNTNRYLDSLISGINARGWVVHEARDIETSIKLIRDRDLSIGIAEFNDRDPIRSIDSRCEILFRSHHFNWLALVSKSVLENDSISRFIGEYFYGYVTLPTNIDRLLVIMRHALGMVGLVQKQTIDDQDPTTVTGIVGQSREMMKLNALLRKIAPVDVPTLITGESGTGKELVALQIHHLSKRAGKKFVVVNCGALSPTLIHSELFGHEKGAFTGANERQIGKIEGASGGTLFLDEIGELPLDLQVILLRFLQEKKIQRISGDQEIFVDSRVLSATNVDLEKAVEKGTFREDLYYRLNVLRLNIPPLRQRGDDIGLLARYFFDKFADEKSRQLKGFSLPAMRAINHYHWPGNIRELMNRVRGAMVMSENRLITPADLGFEDWSEQNLDLTLSEARNKAEKRVIQKALRTSGKNITLTARMLGVSRVTLYRLIDKAGINLEA